MAVRVYDELADPCRKETMSSPGRARLGLSMLAAVSLAAVMSSPASAQQAGTPEARVVTVSGGTDFLNQYMFRGIRQNSTKIAIWPAAELGVNSHARNGKVKGIGLTVGFWNSLHTGDTGSHGPTGRIWYESDFSTTLRFQFSGVSAGATYTAYRSPNSMFTSEKEVAFRLAVDDRSKLGRGAIKPYALVAFEVATKPGEGQADGGLHAGKYLELGMTPEIAVGRAGIATPVRIGLSLGDYYELAGTDNAFGFVSVGAMVTMPVHRSARFGGWNVHGGLEYQVLGKTTKVFNGGDGSKIIARLGVGFFY
jgi:hypothetical protein